MSIDRIDPHSLSPTELASEWAVREEELRIQNEQLRHTEKLQAINARRFEMIFEHVPCPIVLIDNRAFVKDANQAAKRLFPKLGGMKNFYLSRIMDESSGLTLSYALKRGQDEPPTDYLLDFVDPKIRCNVTVIGLSGDDQIHFALAASPE